MSYILSGTATPHLDDTSVIQLCTVQTEPKESTGKITIPCNPTESFVFSFKFLISNPSLAGVLSEKPDVSTWAAVFGDENNVYKFAFDMITGKLRISRNETVQWFNGRVDSVVKTNVWNIFTVRVRSGELLCTINGVRVLALVPQNNPFSFDTGGYWLECQQGGRTSFTCLIKDILIEPVLTIENNIVCNKAIKASRFLGVDYNDLLNTPEPFSIAPGSITSDMIGNNAIIPRVIANNAIETNKIANAAVTTEKIADAAITTEKLADKCVTNAKIGDAVITTRNYANFSIPGTKLTSNSINTSKILDGNVTLPKLGSDVLEHVLNYSNITNKPNITSDSTHTEVSDTLKIDLTAPSVAVTGNLFVQGRISAGDTVTAPRFLGVKWDDIANKPIIPTVVGPTIMLQWGYTDVPVGGSFRVTNKEPGSDAIVDYAFPGGFYPHDTSGEGLTYTKARLIIRGRQTDYYNGVLMNEFRLVEGKGAGNDNVVLIPSFTVMNAPPDHGYTTTITPWFNLYSGWYNTPLGSSFLQLELLSMPYYGGVYRIGPVYIQFGN